MYVNWLFTLKRVYRERKSSFKPVQIPFESVYHKILSRKHNITIFILYIIKFDQKSFILYIHRVPKSPNFKTLVVSLAPNASLNHQLDNFEDRIVST